jgi:hypothetical protein
MEVSGQLHALATLPLGKSPWYPRAGLEVALRREILSPYQDLNHSLRPRVIPLSYPGSKLKWDKAIMYAADTSILNMEITPVVQTKQNTWLQFKSLCKSKCISLSKKLQFYLGYC